MLTVEKLQAMSEDEFRKDVLAPLFKAMGFLDVEVHHGGVLEQGKDIVMWRRDAIRGRENYAVVAKAKPVTGQASGKSSAAEVEFQLRQCFGRPFQDAVTGEERPVHRCIVACPYTISKEARNSIASSLDRQLANHVDYVSGQQLWDLIEEHLGPRTAIAKLEEAGRFLEDASPHHRVVARVRGEQVVLGLERKHADADIEEPILFHGTFQFPDDEEGRAAMEALEQHIKTGSEVKITKPFIAQFEVPPVLKPFLGDDIGEIRLAPARSDRTIPAAVRFETSSGRVQMISGLVFRGVRAGTEEVQIESIGELPYRFVVTGNKATRRVGVSVEIALQGANVNRALEAAQLRAAFREGCRFVLMNADSGMTITAGELAPRPLDDSLEWIQQFLEDLVFIQARTTCVLTVPSRDISAEEVRLARSIAEGLRTGRTSFRNVTELSVTLTRKGVEKFLSANSLSLGRLGVAGAESVRICDCDVNLGRVIRFIEGLEIPPTERPRLVAWLERSASADSCEVALAPVKDSAGGTLVYFDHLPAEEKLQYSQYFPKIDS